MTSGVPSLESMLLPMLTEQQEAMQVPGLVVVVELPSRGRFEMALGVADVGTGESMTAGHRFRIGSITKTMTATVVLQLVQEGRVGLDDPLAAHLPESAVRAGLDTNGATIRQALNMTSGIPTYTTMPFLNGLAGDPARVWTPADLFATVAGRPPRFAAGTGWEPSNTNYVVLGAIAERVGGAPISELFADRCFRPLGLSGCSLPRAGDAALSSPFSRGYQYGTRWDPAPSPPADVPPLVDVTHIDPSWAFGAGDGIGTARDLARWTRALVTGELLDPALQRERLQFAPGSDPPYGLGIARYGGLLGHNGQVSGYFTQAASRTSDGTIIVVLTNVTQTPDLRYPAIELSQRISDAIPVG